jgi:outer membrane lipoprotein-sorting protein
MNWTSLSDNLLYLFFLTFLLSSFAIPTNAQEDPFARLKQKFVRGEIFNADFHHQSIDSYTQDTVASGGEIWVGETRYKVQTDHQSVVVDGKISKVYDNNRNRVIISKYAPEEDDFAPSRILNGVDSTFTVQTQEQRNNHIYIHLSSEDPFAIYKKVEIYLSTNLIPQRIRAVDPVDNVITTSFDQGQFISPEEGMFVLNYPDSAEVVDMRN